MAVRPVNTMPYQFCMKTMPYQFCMAAQAHTGGIMSFSRPGGST
jgi:hypothetical protein